MPNAFIQNFNSGELSPLIDGRGDLDRYRAGCRHMTNFIPLPYGPAMGRPGLEYMGGAASNSYAHHVIPFTYSTSTRFVLEFGELTLRFWNVATEALVESGGSPYSVVTPYAASELKDVQYKQLNDVVILTHPNHHPQRLTRVADDNWTFEDLPWDYPPLLDENTTTTTITPSATTGTGITLTASTSVFDSDQVGGYYQIGHTRDSPAVNLGITSNGTSSSIYILGSLSFTTGGLWSATVSIERSTTNAFAGEETTVRTYTGDYSRNITDSVDETDGAYYRIRVSSWSAGTSATDATNPVAYLDATDATVYGLVKITGYTSGTVVTADVVNDLDSPGATTLWSEGAFSDFRGFPRAVSFHEQRLLFAATSHQPQTVWGSVTGDIYRFRYTSLDDGAFNYTLAAQEGNAIVWLESEDVLLIGTTANEWSMSGGAGDEVITPTNVKVRKQSSYGSKAIQAQLAGDALLFVQRAGQRVRELAYSFEADKWKAPDLNKFAEHIAREGITQIAIQQQPETILWATLGNGEMVSLTYDRENNVVAWARHTTTGEFESVAVVYGDTNTDEVWTVVKRTINGSTVRYIERLDPAARDKVDSGTQSSMIYLDAATVTTTDGDGVTVSGLSHLEGETVSILADGAVRPTKTVASGQITLTRSATDVVVGIPYYPTLQPMKLDFPLDDGSSHGRSQRVNRLGVQFWKTFGCQTSDSLTSPSWKDMNFRTQSDTMGQKPDLFTGEKEAFVKGGFREWVDVAIRQTLPLPIFVVGLIVKFEINGD